MQPEDAQRRAKLQCHHHATAKIDKDPVRNLVGPVVHTGVIWGPNSNLNTFIFDYGS